MLPEYMCKNAMNSRLSITLYIKRNLHSNVSLKNSLYKKRKNIHQSFCIKGESAIDRFSRCSTNQGTSKIIKFLKDPSFCFPAFQPVHTKLFYADCTLQYCTYIKQNQRSNRFASAKAFDDLFMEDYDNKNNTNVSADHVERNHISTRRSSINPERVELLYVQPVQTLINIYSTVNAELNSNHTPKCKFSKKIVDNTVEWTCTLQVTWPKEMEFTAIAQNKKLATRNANLKCLAWLHDNDKVRKGQPVIYDSFQAQAIKQKCTHVEVTEEQLTELKDLVEVYNNNVKNIITESLSSMSTDDANGIETIRDVKNQDTTNDLLFAADCEQRNKYLYSNLMKSHPTDGLPIFQYRVKILEALQNNQILLIKGDTGCGKTTQVPQFILNSFIKRGKGAECNILVSQPRRIAAISLADTIARERSERVGDVIGYRARLQSKVPLAPGQILFCTIGILLKTLQTNPNLYGYSHVILDEAHERSLGNDLLLALLKNATSGNPHLKLIVMSATINAELFNKYLNCSVIEVPGRLYPVKMHFLEDIEKILYKKSQQFCNDQNEDNDHVHVNCQQIASLVQWISRNQPEGAILCFLPGWAEITQVEKVLLSNYKLLVLKLHSKMSKEDQLKIFEASPFGMRKVILATDIAETGITVADVVYVIDSATRREQYFDNEKGISSLVLQYVSRANIEQRKGRAGRVQPGLSYHLITRKQYEELQEYPIPEIMKTSLAKAVLESKIFSPTRAHEFFANLPSPPDATSVDVAVQNLVKLGAFDKHERLTSLGKRIARLSVEPFLGKALVYSIIFECAEPVITIVTALSSNDEIFQDMLANKLNVRNAKSGFHPASDHLAIYWMYKQWKSLFKKSATAADTFCHTQGLISGRMKILDKICRLHCKELADCGMVLHTGEIEYKNNYADRDELVSAILLSATNKVLRNKNYIIKHGTLRTTSHNVVALDGLSVRITPESVNYNRQEWSSPYLTYVRGKYNNQMRTMLINETSIVTPISVILFNQDTVQLYQKYDDGAEDKIYLKVVGAERNLMLSCNKDVADVLLEFRDIMWSVVDYIVKMQGSTVPFGTDAISEINNYKERILRILATLLIELPEETRSDQESGDENIHR